MMRRTAADVRRIHVRLDPAHVRRWQVRLLAGFAALPGVVVSVRPLPGLGWPRAAGALLRLEAALYGAAHAADAARMEEIAALGVPVRDSEPPAGDGTLVIDLSGWDGEPEPGVITPLYDGRPFEAAALAALLDGRAPRLALRIGRHVHPVGTPAVENPRVALHGLDNVLSRIAEALRGVVGGALPERTAVTGPMAGMPGAGRSARFLLSTLSAKAARRIARLAGRTEPVWQVALRALHGGPSLRDGAPFDPARYRRLPDDGRRYYADPFLIAHEGRTWLFVEEYPYATGKGIISAAPLGPDGRPETPRPVLETDSHLSYPHLFHHEGALWMIPESEQANEVALYRCVRFPNRWEKAAALIPDIRASDATVMRDETGRFWMFATTRPDGWASSWDALSLFMADDLTGPWVPHPSNPVLLDAAAARPGGAMFRRAGRWWRPVQDSRAGYGVALALYRIDALAPDRFAQTLTRHIDPRPLQGLHTLNVAGGFEAVDVFDKPPGR